MRILIFTEGTIIMHRSGLATRFELFKQQLLLLFHLHDFASYMPIGNAVQKLKKWKSNGAEILYLTSRTRLKEIEAIRAVLDKHEFPDGKLLFGLPGEGYAEIAETVVPDVLIEDDCASIGGIAEMVITRVRPELKKKIKSIPVKEFYGIDHLPDKASELLLWK